MDTLEVRNSIFEMVSHVQEPNRLLRLREVINDFIIYDEEFEEEGLTDEQEAELDLAIAETYDSTKLTPHAEVVKMMETWLKE